MKIECEEIAAIRTLILRNCHDDLLNHHTKLDAHEFYSLMTYLEDQKQLPAKLESQIKAEILQCCDAFMSRPILRARIDEDIYNNYKRILSNVSYNRLPKVRSTAKMILHNISNNIQHPPDSILFNHSSIDAHLSFDGDQEEDRVYVDPEQLHPDKPSPASGKYPNTRSRISIKQEEDTFPVQASSPSPLQKKRDEYKIMKQKDEVRESNDHELTRGIHIIDEPLSMMTKGKGWAPNVRARNYLKAHSGGLAGGGGEGGEMFEVSERIRERRENRSKGRAELQGMLTVNKSRGRSEKGRPKYGMLDEEGEKKRKRRLVYISKGIDPEDPHAEEKLKEVLKREEYEENNVFEKRRRSLS